MLWTNGESNYDSNIPLWVNLDDLIWDEWDEEEIEESDFLSE